MAAERTGPARVRATESLRHRDYRYFWIGALISNTGAWMQRATVPWVLWQLTGSPLVIGIATFVQFIPVVVFGPVGGSIADRFPRRTILLVTQTFGAVLAFALWILWVSGAAEAWSIIAVVALVGASFGINGPTWQAFISELVPRPLLLNAVTLNSTQFNAARAMGPALAGIVIALWGPGWAFLANAVSFGAVLVALALVRAGRVALHDQPDRPRPLREFAASLRYARLRPGIMASLTTVAALGLLGGPLTQLVVVFAEEEYSAGGAAYGFMAAALGLGAILGAPLVAGRGSGVRRSRVVQLAVTTYGLALVAFALAPVYAFAIVALLVAGAGYLAIASTLNTTIQVQVDESMRGKIMAVYLMSLTLAMPIGALVQGWFAELVGPRPTVAVAGGLFVVVGAVLAFGTGMLPAMDRERRDGEPLPVEPRTI